MIFGGIKLPSREERLKVISELKYLPYLVVDIEQGEKLFGIGVGDWSYAMYFPVTQPLEPEADIDDEVYDKLIEAIKAHPLKVYHNAAYEITEFLKRGVDLDGKFICTMQMAHMVDENVMSKSLDYLHKHYCGGEGKDKPESMKKTIKDLGWDALPLYLIDPYNCQDIKATSELLEVIKPKFEEQFGKVFSHDG